MQRGVVALSGVIHWLLFSHHTQFLSAHSVSLVNFKQLQSLEVVKAPPLHSQADGSVTQLSVNGQ